MAGSLKLGPKIPFGVIKKRLGHLSDPQVRDLKSCRCHSTVPLSIHYIGSGGIQILGLVLPHLSMRVYICTIS